MWVQHGHSCLATQQLLERLYVAAETGPGMFVTGMICADMRKAFNIVFNIVLNALRMSVQVRRVKVTLTVPTLAFWCRLDINNKLCPYTG